MTIAPKAPGYWTRETSGVLRSAVEAYLAGGAMTPGQVTAMRAYLRQWIAAPGWRGPTIPILRASVDRISTRAHIREWLNRAMAEDIDPL